MSSDSREMAEVAPMAEVARRAAGAAARAGAAAVARVAAPSRERFLAEYVEPSEPVILTGLLDGWGSLERFEPTALVARFGACPVTIAPVRDDRMVFDANRGIDLESVTLREAVRRVVSHADDRGYVTATLNGPIRALEAELTPPAYCAGERWRRTRLFINDTGVGSPLHRDFPENLFAQLVGSKRVYLQPPDAGPRLSQFPLASALPNFSPIDFERVGADEVRSVQGLRVAELRAGDVLYLPSRWWHQIVATSLSVSVNFWWARGPYRWLVDAADWLTPVMRRLPTSTVPRRSRTIALGTSLLERRRDTLCVSERRVRDAIASSSAADGGAVERRLLSTALNALVALDVVSHLKRTERRVRS